MAEVVITDSAKTDIKNSISYIKDILCNQKAASNLSDEIIEEILLLKDNPRSGPYVKDSFLANLGFRFLLIKNYKVYYLINGDEVLATIKNNHYESGENHQKKSKRKSHYYNNSKGSTIVLANNAQKIGANE